VSAIEVRPTKEIKTIKTNKLRNNPIETISSAHIAAIIGVNVFINVIG